MNLSFVRLSTVAALVFAFNAAAHAQTAAAAAPPDVVSSTAGSLRVERLAKLEHPWGMAFLPDGRLLITEKPGRLRIFADGKLSEPIGGVPTVVVHAGRAGCSTSRSTRTSRSNQLVYLSYAEAAEQQPAGREGRERPAARRQLQGATTRAQGRRRRARPSSTATKLTDVKVIWRQEPKTIGRGHFGGRLVFAPDGKLFITSGERQRFDPAQDLDANLGKIVRINPDGSIPTTTRSSAKDGARGDV